MVYRAKIKDKEVAVTDRSLIVKDPSRTIDISLVHVESIEVKESWWMFSLGLIILFISLLMAFSSNCNEGFCIEPAMIIFWLLVGIGLAWYGWNNRYLLKIHTLRRTVKLRDGTAIKRLHRRIREQVLRVVVERSEGREA